MESKTKVIMCYSGGKDSSLALYYLFNNPRYQVDRLMCTATADYQRSSMHGVQMELMQRQANSIGLPLDIMWVHADENGEMYKSRMREMLNAYKDSGIHHMAFGDLFLEDIREYREKLNAEVGMASLFPVWLIPTKAFANEFIDLGFKAVITCVDTEQLDASFIGREYNAELLNDLPEGVDWCAENGEFHTFCYDGPIFKEPIKFEKGEQVLRLDRFMYIDLIPV